MRPLFSFPVFLLFFVVSCGTKKSGINALNDNAVDVISDTNGYTIDTMESRQITLVQITDDIEVNWSNENGNFIRDSYYNEIEENFDNLKFHIVNKIGDTTVLKGLKICSSQSYLTLGDVSFLLIDQIKGVPYFQLFGVQFDAYKLGCIVPDGLLDYVSENRIMVSEKLATWLK